MYLLIIQVHFAPVGGKYALKEIGPHSECITNLIMAMECDDHNCICIHVQYVIIVTIVKLILCTYVAYIDAHIHTTLIIIIAMVNT